MAEFLIVLRIVVFVAIVGPLLVYFVRAARRERELPVSKADRVRSEQLAAEIHTLRRRDSGGLF